MTEDAHMWKRDDPLNGVLTDTAAAWAAGLFEGEGCIGLTSTSGNRRPYMRLQLKSTDEDVVRRFAAVVFSATGNENVSGPFGNWGPKGKSDTYKECWQWTATGRVAERVMELLLPHLGARRTARVAEVREVVRAYGERRDA